ncbi:MAG: hypothetical protein DHS20C15_11220 [Planctomycetota bacterium]|nr:MAG: hypothetical protein DHS20C15_11220 [Planctomycetota bacterium]
MLSLSVHAQQGLQGEYFDSTDLVQLVEVRVDPEIDFTAWASSPSGTQVTPDNAYSERWTGFVLVDEPGDWTFSTYSNDGVRLWVDGNLIIDDWTQHAAKIDTGTLNMSSGWHSVRLEHFQNGGSVVLKLMFEGPGQPSVVIPSDRLAVTPGTVAPLVQAPEDRHAVVEHGAIELAATNLAASAIQAWEWTQLGGPAAVLSGADSSTLSVTPLSAGRLDFRVRAQNTSGALGVDFVSVDVIELGQPGGTPSGQFRTWHRGTLDFQGPRLSEQTDVDHPFLDHRLQVLFVHGDSGAAYDVPGFFAADGNAAETGADSGTVWRAHFSPDRPGKWYFKASFREGHHVALSLDPNAGTPTAFDGASGSGFIATSTPADGGFRFDGRLEREGHYLVHQGSDRVFLKGGTNSPENVLAYEGFDQTPASHNFAPHLSDWNSGDPQWRGSLGRSLIGGLNYLAESGVNALYFLTFNVDGDGDDVWPWISKSSRDRFDVSKLAQWEIVFEHMDELGIAQHFVFQERENDEGPNALDGGELGTQRKLYMRELVARFAHHQGVIWNLGEETDSTTEQVRDQHEYLRALDPYHHPIVLHTNPFEKEEVYGPLLSGAPVLDGPSLQVANNFETHSTTKLWRTLSSAAGRPWVICVDELGPAEVGVVPDVNDFWHDGPRKKVLWANLMAGGSGAEWYFGYEFEHNDLTAEDWRSRDHMWALTSHALDFFGDLPVRDMEPRDDLVISDEAWAFAELDETYAVYLPNSDSVQLDLGSSPSSFSVRWFDPGSGEWLSGGVDSVQGPGLVNLQPQPSHVAEDLAVVVERVNQAPEITQLTVSPQPFPGNADLVLRAKVEDPDGFADVEEVRFYFFQPTGAYLWSLPGTYVGDDTWQVVLHDVPQLVAGTWPYGVRTVDGQGLKHIQTAVFVAQ